MPSAPSGSVSPSAPVSASVAGCCSVAAEHRQRGDVLDAAEPSSGLHREGGVALGDGAGRHEQAVLRERVADGLLGEAERGELRGVGRDGDPLADLADERRVAHAVDVGDLGQRGALDLVGERADVVDAGHGEQQHGEVVEAEGDDLRVDVFGQLAGDAVHRREHLLLGEGEVGSVGEARRHPREARGARRRRRLEPGDALDRGLDRGRDIGVDDVGRRARVARDDGELRELDRRRELLLQAREREAAEDRDDDGDERDERAVLHAERGEQVHWSILAAATVANVIGWRIPPWRA